MKPIRWIGLSAICLVLLTARHTAAHEWLRGRGLDVEMRIHGRVVLPVGVREEDVVIEGFTNRKSGVDLQVFHVENKSDFEVWIPVNRDKIWSLRILASTVDGKWFGMKYLDGSEFRQVAQFELPIEIQPCTRRIEVATMLKNHPVAGATVIARFDFGQREFIATSNENGVATFHVPENLKLTEFTAWTDNRRVGGFQFDRGPQRDPAANQFAIELFECKNEAFRFLDDEGVAIPGLAIRFQIATPEPHFNYIGNNPHFLVTTDAQGAIDFHWMPEWESVHYYPEIMSDDWFMPNPEPIDNGEGFDFVLKKQVEIQRVRIAGRVQGAVIDGQGVDLGGIAIELSSFESGIRNQIDREHVIADADGRFEFDGIESSTYCAWIHDPDWVSKFIDFQVPESGSIDSLPEIVLVPEKGVEFEMEVIDSDKQPVKDLLISWNKEHDVEWISNGKRHYGTHRAGRWAKTDARGIAKGRALPGPLEASIYTPLWREKKEIVIVADEVNKVTFQQPKNPEK